MYFLCLLLTTMAVMYAMAFTQLNNVFFVYQYVLLFKLKSSLLIRCDIMGLVSTIFPMLIILEIVISSTNLS